MADDGERKEPAEGTAAGQGDGSVRASAAAVPGEHGTEAHRSSSGRSRHRRSRSKSRRHRGSKSTRKATTVATLALPWVLLAALLVVYALHGNALKGHLETARTQLDEVRDDRDILRDDLKKARERLAVVEQERDDAVRGRLPTPLSAFRSESTIELDAATTCAASITFYREQRGDEVQFTFSLLLQNPTETDIRPTPQILVFDRRGLQIGTAHFEAGGRLTALRDRGLAAGSALVLSGVLELTVLDAGADGTAPKSFFIRGVDLPAADAP